MIFSQRFIKIGFFLTLFFISACSIKTKREPVKADQGSSKLFESAKVDLKSGRKKTGVRKLLQILRNSPNTDIADDAAILIGHTYFKKQGYKKALSFYLRVVNSEFKSPRLAEAQFFAGRCHFFLDQWNQSIELLEQTLSNETIAHNLRYRSLELLYKVYLQQKQPPQ